MITVDRLTKELRTISDDLHELTRLKTIIIEACTRLRLGEDPTIVEAFLQRNRVVLLPECVEEDGDPFEAFRELRDIMGVENFNTFVDGLKE